MYRCLCFSARFLSFCAPTFHLNFLMHFFLFSFCFFSLIFSCFFRLLSFAWHNLYWCHLPLLILTHANIYIYIQYIPTYICMYILCICIIIKCVLYLDKLEHTSSSLHLSPLLSFSFPRPHLLRKTFTDKTACSCMYVCICVCACLRFSHVK